MQTEAFNPFEVESERAYVVYDPRSGEIFHELIVTNFKGGRALSSKQEEAEALAQAKQFGHTAKGLRVLSVDPKRLDGRTPQRVDLKSLKLVRERTQEKTAAPQPSSSKKS
jgi:hypothetical protein